MTFDYDKDKTRRICRSCGDKYKDWYFADVSDCCEDCGITSGHCGFTNMK